MTAFRAVNLLRAATVAPVATVAPAATAVRTATLLRTARRRPKSLCAFSSRSHCFPAGRLAIALLAALCGSWVTARPAAAAEADYDQPPIRYSSAAVSDPVAKLQKRLLSGKVTLERDGERGYLTSLLKAMDIPVSSQVLVFSKTSFQREAIGPRTPRALYFDDDTYVGYVQGGDVLELATTDPNLGPVFYTLDQHPAAPKRSADDDNDATAATNKAKPAARPRFVRQTDNCLQCHAGAMTRDVPGLVMRSVRPDPRGQPILSAGTKLTTHESPLAERFGGWYVTGKHGGFNAQSHLGNLIGKDRDDPDPADPKAGADVTDLSKFFEPSAYPTPGSDLVALLVLSHQVEAHNLMTRANYACKLALRDAAVLNEALGRPASEWSESTHRRIESPAEALVKYLLFCGEAPLAAPVSGTSDYAKEFAARGPRTKDGRSLRDFDLTKRLFRYPLSYLIYSAGFDGLPEPTKAYVYRRLFDVLTGKETDKAFVHLSAGDRRAILEILRETKAGLPDYWGKAESADKRP